MKKWMQKLIDQFDFENTEEGGETVRPEVSDERATLLFLIDTYNKHLLEVDSHPVRKVRETLDDFARELLQPDKPNADRVLFRFRQFFSSYRIDEYTYMQKSFEEFRSILWDFVEQLGEDINFEQNSDLEVMQNLDELKEAVEANSIEDLKSQSRQFIDFYTSFQTKKDERRTQRLESISKNLSAVKKQLTEANHSARKDHLTGAFNRKSFDESLQQHWNLFQISKSPVSMIILDIDHFKKVNDTYGHSTGDYVIQECVRLLSESFTREQDIVARIGGEEFAVIIPDCSEVITAKKADQARKAIQANAMVDGDTKIQFTVSMGVAQLTEGEHFSDWLKRADEALYHSKENGRNTVSMHSKLSKVGQVA